MKANKPTYQQLEEKIARLEKQLAEEKEKYNVLYNQSPEAITILSMDGVIQDFNHEVGFTGYKREELIGKHFSEIATFKDEQELFNSLKSGDVKPFRMTLKSKTGQTLWAEVHPTILKQNDKEYIRILARDITKQVEKENLYEKIINTTADAFWLVDKNRNILEANSAAANMFGYTTEEFKKLTVNDLEVTEDQKQTLNHIQRIIEKGSDLFESRLKRKDGTIITAEISVSYIPGSYDFLVSFIRDISDYKNAEKKLKEQNARINSIFRASPTGIGVVRNRIFKEINDHFCQMTGYSREELMGKSARMIYPSEEEFKKVGKIKYDRIREKGIGTIETVFLRKDGKKINVLMSSSPMNPEKINEGTTFTTLDITEWKNAEEDLKKAKKKAETDKTKVRSILAAIPDIMFIFDKTGNILDYHAENSKKLLLPPKKFIHKNINEVLPTNLIQPTHEKIEKTLETGEMQRYHYNMNINNTKQHFEARMVKMDKNKALAIIRDITETTKNKQDLIIAKEKAEESDRLKSAFLANMSHEIRTPMNGIMGFAQILLEHDFPKKKRNKFLEIIHSRTKDLLRIINDIVDISKIEAKQLEIHKEKSCLNDIIYNLYEAYRMEISHKQNKEVKLQIYNDLPRNKSYIFTDSRRLKQILDNLLSNAIKFTDNGQVEWGYRLKDASTLLFYVRDTGIGINPDNFESIFDRFRQLDSSTNRLYEGTGLGLAITKNLVTMLGGKIWVESKPGEGACFYFTIPYETGTDGVQLDEKEKEEKILNWKGKTLLIVEDDPASQEYMKEVLTPTEIEIIIQENGEKGYKTALENSSIDLILMDIRLPDISGLEIIKKIHHANIQTPIIAQTAYAMGDDRKKCLDAGAIDYIAKPINQKDLLTILKKYV